jgi:hypothetical protein
MGSRIRGNSPSLPSVSGFQLRQIEGLTRWLGDYSDGWIVFRSCGPGSVWREEWTEGVVAVKTLRGDTQESVCLFRTSTDNTT